jgi:hypothetical protein
MSLNLVPGALEKYKIVIITNFNQDAFGKLKDYHNVHIEYVSDEQIDSKSDYIYRVKILALQYFFSKYAVDVLFVDSDTFFISDISHIFEHIQNNTCVMNYKCISIDYVISKSNTVNVDLVNEQDRMLINIYRDINSTKGILSIRDKNRKYRVPSDFTPYGSGLIGMQYKNKDLLNEMLDVCDSMFSKYHYFCSEEFAVSLIFTLYNLPIVIENEVLYHYYLFKEARLFVAHLLNYYHFEDSDLFSSFKLMHSIDSRELSVVNFCELPYYLSFISIENPLSKINQESVATLQFYEVVLESFKGNAKNARHLFKRIYEIREKNNL